MTQGLCFKASMWDNIEDIPRNPDLSCRGSGASDSQRGIGALSAPSPLFRADTRRGVDESFQTLGIQIAQCR